MTLIPHFQIAAFEIGCRKILIQLDRLCVIGIGIARAAGFLSLVSAVEKILGRRLGRAGAAIKSSIIRISGFLIIVLQCLRLSVVRYIITLFSASGTANYCSTRTCGHSQISRTIVSATH